MRGERHAAVNSRQARLCRVSSPNGLATPTALTQLYVPRGKNDSLICIAAVVYVEAVRVAGTIIHFNTSTPHRNYSLQDHTTKKNESPAARLKLLITVPSAAGIWYLVYHTIELLYAAL